MRQYSPAVGGMETYLAGLVRAQRTSGLRVSVLTLNRLFSSRHRLAQYEIVHGVSVRRVPYIGTRHFFVPSLRFLIYLGKFDVVHVHGVDMFFDLLGLLGRLVSEDSRPKLIATLHGGFFHTERFRAIKKVYFKIVTAVSICGFGRVIGDSESDAQIFSKLRPDMRLIFCGVDAMGACCGAGRDLLVLGRLAPNKGLSRVLNAYALCAYDTCVGRLHIVGPDENGMRAILENQVRALGLQRQVVIHGAVTRARLRDVVHGCSVILSGAFYEGFGLTVIEGMSAGLYPIVSNIPSFIGIMERARVGAVCDYDRPAEVADTIVGFLRQSRDVRSRAAKDCRSAVQEYSWPAIAKQVSLCYE